LNWGLGPISRKAGDLDGKLGTGEGMDGGVGYGGGAIGNKVGINGGVINGPPRHSNDKRHLSSEEELN
jgi:hypothetical protein